jgi:hypothetical protein
MTERAQDVEDWGRRKASYLQMIIGEKHTHQQDSILDAAADDRSPAVASFYCFFQKLLFTHNH